MSKKTEVLHKRKDYQDIEASLANLIQQLGEGKPRVLANLKRTQHSAISVALAYSKWLGSKVLDTFCHTFLETSPAIDGKSRKQLTSIGVAFRGMDDLQDEKFFSKVKRKLHIGE